MPGPTTGAVWIWGVVFLVFAHQKQKTPVGEPGTCACFGYAFAEDNFKSKWPMIFQQTQRGVQRVQKSGNTYRVCDAGPILQEVCLLVLTVP